MKENLVVVFLASVPPDNVIKLYFSEIKAVELYISHTMYSTFLINGRYSCYYVNRNDTTPPTTIIPLNVNLSERFIISCCCDIL